MLSYNDSPEIGEIIDAPAAEVPHPDILVIPVLMWWNDSCYDITEIGFILFFEVIIKPYIIVFQCVLRQSPLRLGILNHTSS